MKKIDINEIREKLKYYPPKEIYEDTGVSRNHLYRFLNNKSYNPKLETINAMIDFINRREQ